MYTPGYIGKVVLGCLCSFLVCFCEDSKELSNKTTCLAMPMSELGCSMEAGPRSRESHREVGITELSCLSSPVNGRTWLL